MSTEETKLDSPFLSPRWDNDSSLNQCLSPLDVERQVDEPGCYEKAVVVREAVSLVQRIFTD